MNASKPKEMTALFADVAGSVELYSILGDVKAYNLVSRCLARMSSLVEDNQGRVLDTIGDEIICSFEKADCALNAARAIQAIMHAQHEQGLNIRIGMHSGPIHIDNDLPFGDTINITARVIALAKAGEIMLSEQAYVRLSDKHRSQTRYFNTVHVKGKCKPYIIHQAIHDKNDGTYVISHADTHTNDRRRMITGVTLHHANAETHIPPGKEVLIGRGKQCGLQVFSDSASRIHAVVEFNSGKLIITDRSTNGTFIHTRAGKRETDNKELFIHHGRWTTSSDGILRLGQPVKAQVEDLIYFSCK